MLIVIRRYDWRTADLIVPPLLTYGGRRTALRWVLGGLKPHGPGRRPFVFNLHPLGLGCGPCVVTA